MTESSTNQEEENSSDDYFNENNYVRILNNYRKVVDDELKSDEGVKVGESPAGAKKEVEGKKDAKEVVKKSEDVKENVNKRSGEGSKTANRMEVKESLMKSVANKNGVRVGDKVGINKNLYKKNGDGTPRKPLDELRRDRTTEHYVSVATTEYIETEEERKAALESIKKLESNELPGKVAGVKDVDRIAERRPAPTVATGHNMHKTSESIINSIRNIMNNTHHMKTGASEIHDAQILVKSDAKPAKPEAGKFKPERKVGGVRDAEAATETDEVKPTVYERLAKPAPEMDDKNRLRNTKVLEPTENDARAMPENLSNAFPWSWAKDIFLEKPVAKKTTPNVEDIVADAQVE